MKCPVSGKEARAHIYYCAKYPVYVNEKRWQEHIAAYHTED